MGARVQIKAIRPPCPKCGTPVKRAAAIHCSRVCAGNTKHLGHGSSEYYAWKDMRHRCNMPQHHAYVRYGGRGILVCERWQHSFANFIADMGPKPEKSYSIERIDNDGNYEPANCKWATKKEQARNRRQCWTAEQDRILTDCAASGGSFADAARLLGKNIHTVQAHAYRIGVKSGYRSQANG